VREGINLLSLTNLFLFYIMIFNFNYELIKHTREYDELTKLSEELENLEGGMTYPTLICKEENKELMDAITSIVNEPTDHLMVVWAGEDSLTQLLNFEDMKHILSHDGCIHVNRVSKDTILVIQFTRVSDESLILTTNKKVAELFDTLPYQGRRLDSELVNKVTSQLIEMGIKVNHD
jgi:hypothetical protein